MRTDLLLFWQEFLASVGMFACFFGLSVFFRDDHYLSWYTAHFLLVVLFDHVTVQASMNPSFNLANFVSGQSGLKPTIIAIAAQLLGAAVGFELIDHYFPQGHYDLISCPPAHEDFLFAVSVELIATFVFAIEVYSTLYLLPDSRVVWASLLALTLRALMLIGDSLGVNVVMNSMVGVGCVLKDVPLSQWAVTLSNWHSDYMVIYVHAPTIGAVAAAVMWFPLQRLMEQRARAEKAYVFGVEGVSDASSSSSSAAVASAVTPSAARKRAGRAVHEKKD